jgi:hypothetical protein
VSEEKDKIIDEIYESLMAGEEPEDAVMIQAVDLEIDIRVIRDIVEAMLSTEEYFEEE